MRKHIFVALLVALALTLSGGLLAQAAPSDSDMGALSDRYESLNVLGNSLTEEEGVVIETRIGVLTSVNRALDNSDVRVTGEVVGSVLNAEPGYKWANVMGSAHTSISVFMTDEQASFIQNTGSYHAVGTSMKITGIYHVACPEHQGELDIHASNVEVVDMGGPVTHLVSTERMHAAFALCTLGMLILIVYLVLRGLRARRAKS